MPRITAKRGVHMHCMHMIMFLSLPPPLRACLFASEAFVVFLIVILERDIVVMA